MRLAVFTNEFPARVSTFFARDMRGLIESGIEVDIFAIYPLEPERWKYVPNILSESILSRSRVYHLSLPQGFRSLIKPLPLRKFGIFLRCAVSETTSAVRFRSGSFSKNTYVLLKGLTWVQQHRNTYDHILAYWGNYAASCAYIYHRLTDKHIPFSIFFHASIDLYNTSAWMRSKLLYADNIITCSEFNRQFIRNHCSKIFHCVLDNIYVHHHGLDFSEFQYEIDRPSTRKIIAVGRLVKQKGFDYLLYATHKLKCQGIDIEVELVGSGPEADTLKALAHELRITDRVRFRGWLTFDEVLTAMRQATIIVHPSPALGDGVPNVIKEAMALGTPVVASSIAGIPELLDHGRCGALIPPRNVEALANAIETLVTNDTLRQQYAKRAREYVEKMFDLWRNGQSLAELLRSTTRKIPTAPLRR